MWTDPVTYFYLMVVLIMLGCTIAKESYFIWSAAILCIPMMMFYSIPLA